MASYHLSAQPVKRSEGRSVVAMAAYRAGVLLRDQRRGVEVDYRRRRGVVHSEIMAPDDAASWLLDRESLWNGVERMEARRDAQLAREINMALPHELTDEQRLSLARKFVREQFVSCGMVADLAIHAPVVEKGDDPRNFHAHVLLTLRQAGGGGLRRVKTRQWNSKEELRAWRRAWAGAQNEMLRAHGHRGRVDHRSLAAQRTDAIVRQDRVGAAKLTRVPEVHVGPQVKAATLRKLRLALMRSRRDDAETLERSDRGEANVQRLSANARTYEALIEKIHLQQSRLRRHHARYSQATVIHEQASSEDATAKYVHALERRELVARLIHELDLVFLALLGIRESQLVRQTEWSNRLKRWQVRQPLLPGRTRPRVLDS